jgi:two-component system, NarL family, response regulator
MSLSVLIVDDHPMIRAGLAATISSDSRFVVGGEASNGTQAIALFHRVRPDIVLMDLQMPDCGGIEAIEGIRIADPVARIVILTSFDAEEDIFRGLRAGALAYVLKDAPREELLHSIELAAHGARYLPPNVSAKLADRLDHCPLSKRELQILQLLSQGLSNKRIGLVTNVAESTVKFHVKNILEKLCVTNRGEAVSVACRRGILKFDDAVSGIGRRLRG